MISDPCEILKLAQASRQLAAEPEMCTPQVFLASVLANAWKPWAVAVTRNGRIAGLLYCKGRLIAGIGTGIVFGDDALGMMLAAPREEAGAVISCALGALIANMRRAIRSSS